MLIEVFAIFEFEKYSLLPICDSFVEFMQRIECDTLNYHLKLNPMKFHYLLLLISILLISCGIGHPPFDSDTPDTKNNVFHYEHLINVKISEDVKNLYTFGWEFTRDPTYCLSFKCNKETAYKIIEQNEMTLDTKKGIGLSIELEWWNNSDIDTLLRYQITNSEETYFKYFWYNENTNQAYFLDFDV